MTVRDEPQAQSPCRIARPAREHIPSYLAALDRGWGSGGYPSGSPQAIQAGRADREAIDRDVDQFLAGLVDREGKGPPVLLPDGSTVPRLPGYVHWLWDGEFCGVINFRWQPGTTALPPTCLGHIGYSVVPWKQRRGYATAALAQLLPVVRQEGLPFVEITTDPDNVASRRVVERNGGELFETFVKPAAQGGTPGLRYRISLG